MCFNNNTRKPASGPESWGDPATGETPAPTKPTKQTRRRKPTKPAKPKKKGNPGKPRICDIHGVAMTQYQNSKTKGKFWSHRLPDRSWCHGSEKKGKKK